MIVLNLLLPFFLILGVIATSRLESAITIVKDGPGACSETQVRILNQYYPDLITLLKAGLEMYGDVLKRETIKDNPDAHLRQKGAKFMFEAWFGIQFKDPNESDGKGIENEPVDYKVFSFVKNILEKALAFLDHNEPFAPLKGIEPRIYCHDDWIQVFHLDTPYIDPHTFQQVKRFNGKPKLIKDMIIWSRFYKFNRFRGLRGMVLIPDLHKYFSWEYSGGGSCSVRGRLAFASWSLGRITMCPAAFTSPNRLNLPRGRPPGPLDSGNRLEHDQDSGSMILLHEILHLVLGPENMVYGQRELSK
ncbi:hypothetical protein TWF281_007499 [Arthrobotrys megalospora]